MSTTQTPDSGSKGVFKRLIIGRAVASNRLEHTLLPKRLALPVFSSDALSSVAYATEEILTVLFLVTLVPYGYLMPIALAIAVLLAIVITSYRQTVRAYPQGGGAYRVSKENLGTGAGLVAAASILTDYILTVSVSITAGVLAITAAFPELSGWRVEMAIAFIVLVTVMNIRGVKESGSIFAVPTYAFIGIIFTTIAVGLFRCVFGDGCPVAPPEEMMHGMGTAVGGVTLFVLLRAFAAGSTALTGVEAISDGVQAFRRPQSKNAAATLAIMGTISISMFMGISYLASQAHVVKSEDTTVVAQIAGAVFGAESVGFYLVQAFTAAILILAANTAYQDFPRLASILATDHYMPRQFMNRGDRLVFSNGIIGLALIAGLLIVAFDANLERLIHLYVLGVFTSFTLSQAGMVKHWLAERHKEHPEKGWRRSIVINAVGATATFVVALVVAVTKFAPEGWPRPGAWMVMVAIPIIVFAFYRVHGHYEAVRKQLDRGVEVPNQVGSNHVVLLVTGMGPATAEALGYIKSFNPTDFHAIWVNDGDSPEDLRRQWAEFAPGAPALEVLSSGKKQLLGVVRAFVQGIEREPQDFVSVVVPELVRGRLSFYLLKRRRLIQLKSGLLREPNVVVCDAPVISEGGERLAGGVDGHALIPQRTVALVFVSGVNDATVRAVNYARTLRATETRAVHIALDPEKTGEIAERWAEEGQTIPLEIVEAPFRDLTGPLLEHVRAVTARQDTLAAVVIPEFIVPKWRHLFLHNQNALFVKRLMLYEPRVVLTSVPFVLDRRAED